jgi:predicted ATPase
MRPTASCVSATVRSVTPRLFGRDRDLARLRAKLGSGARLVTLFGPAGIGKTALARELARVESGGDRVVFADLAEVRDRAGVCGAVGRALGVPLDPRREPSDHLAAVLRAQAHRVVVLDACDHAIDTVAEVVRGWTMADLPTVFVVTSREVLGLSEEHAYEVGPLAVPPPGEHDSDAVAMFLARAEQTRREALRSADPEIIADVVRSLEGIPLALELAAGRLSVLSAAELRARLGSRLSVLASHLRTEHPRQRTMRAAIEWSSRQLEPHEQAALRQLSVFRGGFDVRAAEAVIDLSAYDGGARVIDVLQSLRAKSFIRGDEAGGEVRLGLYEIIRELGAQALRETGEEDAATRRHAAYFVAQASPTEDLDNLLAVHARALEGRTNEGIEDAFRVLVHLELVMWTSLPAHRTLALIDQTLAAAVEPNVAAALRCELLLRRSRALELMGRADAREPAETALSLARDVRSARLEGSALMRLGSIDIRAGELRRACEKLRSAVEILPEHDPPLAADAFRYLGTSLRTLGEVEEARMAHEESLAIRGRLGDERGAGVDLACLAALHYQQGQLEPARVLLEESLARAERFDDRYTVAYALGVLGSVLAELGQLHGAMARFGDALERLEELGERRLYGGFLGYAAVVHQLAGALDVAQETYSASLAVLREQGDRLQEGLFAGAASTLAWAQGRADEAESLHAMARDRLTELSGSIDERLTTALSLHLGHRDLWLHRTALGGGDERAAKAHLEDARRRLTDAAVLVDDNDDLRIAYRLLQHAVEGEVPAPSGSGDIELDPSALWFRVGSRPRVDLRRRRALRLVLQALVEERERAPGVPVPMQRLIATGWPGEKILLQAGLSRLYVTVRSLRELGLRSALLRQDDGYLLDPNVRLSQPELRRSPA